MVNDSPSSKLSSTEKSKQSQNGKKLPKPKLITPADGTTRNDPSSPQDDSSRLTNETSSPIINEKSTINSTIIQNESPSIGTDIDSSVSIKASKLPEGKNFEVSNSSKEKSDVRNATSQSSAGLQEQSQEATSQAISSTDPNATTTTDDSGLVLVSSHKLSQSSGIETGSPQKGGRWNAAAVTVGYVGLVAASAYYGGFNPASGISSFSPLPTEERTNQTLGNLSVGNSNGLTALIEELTSGQVHHRTVPSTTNTEFPGIIEEVLTADPPFLGEEKTASFLADDESQEEEREKNHSSHAEEIRDDGGLIHGDNDQQFDEPEMPPGPALPVESTVDHTVTLEEYSGLGGSANVQGAPQDDIEESSGLHSTTSGIAEPTSVKPKADDPDKPIKNFFRQVVHQIQRGIESILPKPSESSAPSPAVPPAPREVAKLPTADMNSSVSIPAGTVSTDVIASESVPVDGLHNNSGTNLSPKRWHEKLLDQWPFSPTSKEHRMAHLDEQPRQKKIRSDHNSTSTDPIGQVFAPDSGFDPYGLID